MPRRSEGASTAEALYLYCVARAGRLAAVAGPGVDGGPAPGLIRVGEVVAVVSRVRVGDFLGPAAEAQMRDLGWMGARVRRHHHVIEQVRRHSPVVPARFAVLFSSAGRLRAWLGTHHDTVARALDRFEGRDEWAVKATRDERQAEAARLQAAPRRAAGAPGAGARYLRERSRFERGLRPRKSVRRLASDARGPARGRPAAGTALGEVSEGAPEAPSDVLARLCAAVLDELTGGAVEVRARPVVALAPGGAARETANWAFLVSRDAVRAFVARVERINAEQARYGLRLRVSGPWPPWSFCPPLGPPEEG